MATLKGTITIRDGIELVVKNCAFSNNTGMRGPVFYNSNVTSIQLYDTDINFNTASGGDIIYTEHTNNFTIANCTFHKNDVVNGAGGAVISIAYSKCYITEGIFIGNFKQGNYKTNEKAVFSIVLAAKNSSLTIDGGLFQDNGVGGVTGLYSTKVYVQYSVFTKNFGKEGAALYVETNTELGVFNCSFTSNYASIGSVISGRHRINISIQNSIFEKNIASMAATVCLDQKGTLIVENSSFMSNIAPEAAGIRLTNHISGHITNCKFLNNRAIPKEIDIDLIKYKDTKIPYNSHGKNSPYFLSDHGFGGALLTFENVNLSLKHCHLSGNTAMSFGGAVYAYQQSNINIESSIFEANTAYRGGAIAIGGVTESSRMTILDTTFTRNYAIDIGGVIFSEMVVYLNITSCEFYTNIAAEAAVFHLDGRVIMNLTLSNIFNNEGKQQGGIIRAISSSITLSKCTISWNSASQIQAILLDSSMLFAHMTNFSGFTVDTSYIIAAIRESQLLLDRCHVFNNSLEDHGLNVISNVFSASLILVAGHSVLEITHSVFSNNRNSWIINCVDMSSTRISKSSFAINSDVGILYADLSNRVTLENLRIENNTANEYGSLIYSRNATVTMFRSNVQHNKAESPNALGGIIHGEGGNIVLQRNNFSYNSVGGFGAVLHMISNTQANLKIFNNKFLANFAKNKGAVFYAAQAVDIAIDSCAFLENVAKGDSAAYLNDIHVLRISNTNFELKNNKPVMHILQDTTGNTDLSSLYLIHNLTFKRNDILNASSSTSDLSETFIYTDNSYQAKLNETLQESPYASGMKLSHK